MLVKNISFTPEFQPKDPSTSHTHRRLFSREECEDIKIIAKEYPVTQNTLDYGGESHRDCLISWLLDSRLIRGVYH